jgi:hypothetical protein
MGVGQYVLHLSAKGMKHMGCERTDSKPVCLWQDRREPLEKVFFGFESESVGQAKKIIIIKYYTLG